MTLLYCRGLVERENNWNRVECMICDQFQVQSLEVFSNNLPSANFVIQEQGLNNSSKTIDSIIQRRYQNYLFVLQEKVFVITTYLLCLLTIVDTTIGVKLKLEEQIGKNVIMVQWI